MSERPQFCPVPASAMGDARLSASHWRVLATIAFHDRFGANSTGCYASATTLAKEAGVHPKNLAGITTSLQAWGYLTVSRNPLNRRVKTYSLIYNKNPATLRENTEYRPGRGSSAAGTAPPEGDTPRIHVVANAIGSHVSEQSQPHQGVADVNIFPEGESKRSCEAEINLTEAWPSGDSKTEEPLHQAYRRVIQQLGVELHESALEKLSVSDWQLIQRTELDEPGKGVALALKLLKGVSA